LSLSAAAGPNRRGGQQDKNRETPKKRSLHVFLSFFFQNAYSGFLNSQGIRFGMLIEPISKISFEAVLKKNFYSVWGK
jgi:hypothetical protein